MKPNPTTRTRREPDPIDAARLEQLALGYVARFATSRGKLASYLARKLRERGWAGDDDAPPPLEAIVERLAGAGYVDDAAFAQARRGSLLRRGYGARRIEQALGAAGIAAETREALRPAQAAARQAALALARRRGFGPFGQTELPSRDPRQREKQLAAMLRAGHPLDSARIIVDARSVAAASAWAWEDEE